MNLIWSYDKYDVCMICKQNDTLHLMNLYPSAGTLRTHTVEKLWSITENLNILYKENWTRLASEEVLEFQRALFRTMRNARIVRSYGTPSDGSQHRWTFGSSFLYSLTLITTIGESCSLYFAPDITQLCVKGGSSSSRVKYVAFNGSNGLRRGNGIYCFDFCKQRKRGRFAAFHE